MHTRASPGCHVWHSGLCVSGNHRRSGRGSALKRNDAASCVQRRGKVRTPSISNFWFILFVLTCLECLNYGIVDATVDSQSPEAVSSGSLWMNPEGQVTRGDRLVESRWFNGKFPNLSCNVTFSPTNISIGEDQTQWITYNAVCDLAQKQNDISAVVRALRIVLRIEDDTIAEIGGQSDFNHTIVSDTGDQDLNQSWVVSTVMEQEVSSNNTQPTTSPVLPAEVASLESITVNVSGNFSIRGLQFGRTVIELRIVPLLSDGALGENIMKHGVVVKKQNALIDIIYLAIIGIMIVVYNFGFGCKVRSELILQIVKRPVAPAIGFCCQFLVMAPLSFGIAKLLKMSSEAGLGLLAIGSAPGGGGSNVFAYLLNGDLELSITMTFTSTVASLAMTPLWIWALGRFFRGTETHFRIPVVNVFSSLAIVTIPVILGILVGKFKPQAAKKIAWCLKPATAIIGIVFISFGVYVYYSALVRVMWQTLVACIIVPFCGYSIGAGMGKICRQPRERWITISLETGFQNLALSLMIISTSLKPPESDLAGVVPICYTFLSAAMPAMVFIIKLIVRACKGDKPLAESGSFDIGTAYHNPLHEFDSPAKRMEMGSVAGDNTNAVCTVSTIADGQLRTNGPDVTQPAPDGNGNIQGATHHGKENGQASPTSDNFAVDL